MRQGAQVRVKNGSPAYAITRTFRLKVRIDAAPRGKPKPPTEPRTPPVVEFLRKALEWQALLASGQAKNQADIARREGISRVRVTQVMWLLRLAPEIKEHVLGMPETVHRPAISERALRPIAHLKDVTDQKARFQKLVGEVR